MEYMLYICLPLRTLLINIHVVCIDNISILLIFFFIVLYFASITLTI